MVSACTNDRCWDFRGLSTDIKPLEWNGIPVGNSSTFFEIDTSDVYMFDEESQTWVKLG